MGASRFRTGQRTLSSLVGNPHPLSCCTRTDETGGENISSVALESLLAEHPSILEAAVVAIPDEQWGERPKAYVTGRNASSPPDPAAVIAWAREQGKTFMVPKEVEVLKELPKTSTGKIRKNVLREWARGKKSA